MKLDAEREPDEPSTSDAEAPLGEELCETH